MKERKKKKLPSTNTDPGSVAVDRFTPDQLSILQQLHRSGTRSPTKEEAGEILGEIGNKGRVGNLLSSNMVLEWFKAVENNPLLCSSLSEGTPISPSLSRSGIRVSRSHEEKPLSKQPTNSDHLFTSTQMQLLEGAFLDEPNPTQEELADLLEKIGKEGRLKGATISVAKLHRWFAHKRDRVEQEEQQRQLLLQQQEQQEDFSSSSSPAKTPTPQRGLDKSPFSKSSLSRAQGQNRNWSLEDDILSFSLFQKRGPFKSPISPVLKNSPLTSPTISPLSSPSILLPLPQCQKAALLLQAHNHLLSRSLLSLLLSLTLDGEGSDENDRESDQIREELMNGVLLLHGDPYGLFLCCLEEELEEGSNIATVARQRTPSVRCLQFLYSSLDLGRVINPLKKFANSLTKAQLILLEGEGGGEGGEGGEMGLEKRARLKERFLGSLWKGLRAEKLPTVIGVVCAEAEKKARGRFGEVPVELSTTTLKEWAVGAFFLLRFLVPQFAGKAEGGKGMLFLAKFLMKLCSDSCFQGKGCLANEVLQEAREGFKNFCASLIQRGKEAAPSFRWVPLASFSSPPPIPHSFSSSSLSPRRKWSLVPSSCPTSPRENECFIPFHFFGELGKRRVVLEKRVQAVLGEKKEKKDGEREESEGSDHLGGCGSEGGSEKLAGDWFQGEGVEMGNGLVYSFLGIGDYSWGEEEEEEEGKGEGDEGGRIARPRSKSGVEVSIKRVLSEH